MTAVARVLPRAWDSRRLLRFLTGLALAALAFAVPAPLGVLPALPAVAPVPVTFAVVLLLAGVVLRVSATRAPPAA